jgi:cytochrome c
VVGRNHGSVPDFKYSDAMLAHKDEVWTPDLIYAFIKGPKAAMPGTKMGFAGLPSPQDRANVIAYLSTLK